MVILFTLWFILNWQFPTWLWIGAGFFYIISLKPKKKIKKRVPFSTAVLPLSLALAIIFGKNILGDPILPNDISKWNIIGIFAGSVFIRLVIASPIIKKQISKNKNSNNNVTIHGGGIELNDDSDDDELKLYLKITNKEKNKTSNFKLSLENGFIKEKFVQNVILKNIQNSWNDPIFKDDSGKPLFDLNELYNKAKNNPIKGELLSIDNEKISIIISIK